jgi:hypothetical protein
MDCKSEAQAIEVARSIARQIELDVKNTGVRNVLVKTDDGQKVHQEPIKQ